MEFSYFPRISDRILTRKLNAFSAVYIVGPKWCGKTSTAEQQAKSVLYLQDPRLKSADISPRYC